ncbi:MAG: ADP-ribosylglycohydrolase family protein [Chroococcidiopsidaceae cyanobacterium CP_BM_RX_35]|nr:ADP-ribosylglycohydrolase family protein [Chroococcidiopsidaceae cyanobacterium CP_BM_RX_35]
MRYSLLSRFRGCWLGAALGGIYNSHSSPQLFQWRRLAVLGAESLIEQGRFEPEDWCARFSAEFPNLNAKDSVFPEEALITSVPVALFYHENEIKLRQNLLALVKILPESIGQDRVLAMGYAIAQSLNEKLNPATLIPQLISFLRVPSQLAQDLTLVQTFLEQGSSLGVVATQIQQQGTQLNSGLALALYCFLSTAEDYRLSVARAAQTGAQGFAGCSSGDSRAQAQSQITATLTGALSGAHNSTVGIPASLRMVMPRSDTVLADWGMNMTTQMLELADKLLAAWSGVYGQSQRSSIPTQIAALSAPRVILLPRSGLHPR